MTYRRAFLLLLLIILIASSVVFVFFSKRIDAPPWSVAVASIIAVGGGILAFLPNLHDAIQFVLGIFSRKTNEEGGESQQAYTMDSPGQKRNRENLLANIRETWIEGALRQSLHNAILIELGISVDPEAVSRSTRPWDMLLQKPNENFLLPTEKRIEEVFTENGSSLLILGEPGSGKTITLLQLAESLVNDAQADATCPIPVVLNLSSWAHTSPH